jgi:hypothetical protein
MLRAYPQQTHEMLFDAHNHAFRVLGGVPRRGIYDNMRTAVDKIGRGKERQVNARFSAMVSHFLFEAKFCNPASGWEKGQIEKNAQDARHRFWQPAPNFPSLAALNDWLEARCRERWAQTLHGSQPGAIADVWAEEVGRLMQLSRPFDGFVGSQARRPVSSPFCCSPSASSLNIFRPSGSGPSAPGRRHLTPRPSGSPSIPRSPSSTNRIPTSMSEASSAFNVEVKGSLAPSSRSAIVRRPTPDARDKSC